MVTRIWKSVHISELQLPPSKLCKSPFWPLVFLNMKKNPRHSKGESQVKIKKKKRESDITQNLSYVAIMFDRLFIKILRYSVFIYIYIKSKHVLLSFFALGSIFSGLEISPHTCQRFLHSKRFVFMNIHR